MFNFQKWFNFRDAPWGNKKDAGPSKDNKKNKNNKNNKSNKKNEGKKADNVIDDVALTWLFIIEVSGIIALVAVSFYAAEGKFSSVFWKSLGLSFLISLAAALVGGFLGFLFGIPRSLQKDQLNVANGGAAASRRAFSNNTNLEEISDWLTKIIVGVSLIQLGKIRGGFEDFSAMLSRGFETMNASVALPYVYAMLVVYGVSGFITVFLWARIYLLRQLIWLDRSFDATEIASQVNTRQDILREIENLERRKEDFDRIRNRIATLENRAFKDVIAKARPGTVKYIDDCQKGRWGGVTHVNGYQLSADFKTIEYNEEIYEQITLRVFSPEQKPLTGKVYFFLHDTYFPEMIKEETAVNNEASIEIVSYEAFTVGAYLFDADTKLELDLNTLKNAPASYKYDEKLLTIDDINRQLAALRDSTQP